MWISVAAVVLLLGVIALICFKSQKNYDAKHIAAAGITIALSFALSYAKISPVQYGGSITFASFVPVLIYAYVYGLADGLLAGIIFGLLNFISGPYILTPLTFILDYPLAFASIGLMGIASKFTKKQTFNVVLGTIGVYVIRFIFHWISGIIYFQENAIWVSLPEWAFGNAFIYSFIYQCIYLPADCAIAAVCLYILSKTKVLDRLIHIIQPASK
jgi:thiamine transporter